MMIGKRLVATAAMLMLASGCGGMPASDVARTPSGDSTTPSDVTVEIGEVDIEGEPLPSFVAGQPADPAVGMPAPVVTGEDFTGNPAAIPTDEATVLVFLAHWCPHCRAELPVLVDLWIEGQGLPDGVSVVAVPTGTDPGQANYPPSAWLKAEGWDLPVLLDDANGSVAQAFGLSSYPFFVAIDAAGNVTARSAGTIPPEQVQELVATATS